MARPVVVLPAYQLEGVRARNADLVLAHLREEGAVTVTVAPLGPSSRAAARNLGVELALRDRPGLDVIVFVDADTLVPGRQLYEAALQAKSAPGLVYGYDLYVRLDRETSEQLHAGGLPAVELLIREPWRITPERTLANPASVGCAAIAVDELAQVGGFDQRYTGWGYEDCDLAGRCARRHPVRRVPGPVFHLWHGPRNEDDSPADSDPAQVARNRRLWLDGIEILDTDEAGSWAPSTA